MALVPGTATRYDMVGLREDLTNTIFNISPMDTPLVSGLKRTRAVQTLHEWQMDSLAAADGTNAQLEGDDAAFSTPAATVRVGNQTQISRKTLVLSDTLEVVSKAGRRSERAYQMAKRGKELKRDLETIMFQPQGGDGGAVGTPRKLASLLAWVKSNVSMGATGANPSWTSGVPSAARTDGTQRAVDETMFKAVIQSAWTAGGEPRIVFAGAWVKTQISAFNGIATHTVNVQGQRQTTIVAAADVYVSDFGNLRVVPTRFQRGRDLWLIDFDLLAMPMLRPLRTKKLAATGDAEKELMVMEYTLQVGNEAGLGLVADLLTS